MTTTPDPAGAPPRALDGLTVVLVLVLGTVLVAGYVVLAALGRDTTGYLLFLGGPAVTGIVGAVLNRRVQHVSTAVATTQAETRAVVEDGLTDLEAHLGEQDEVLSATAADAAAARRLVAGPAPVVPAARAAGREPFGPVRSGLVQRETP